MKRMGRAHQMSLLTVAVGWLVGLALAPAAIAAVLGPETAAPGRVMFPVGNGLVADEAGGAVAVPGGGAILVGSGPVATDLSQATSAPYLFVVKVGPSGQPDPLFGEGGAARIPGSLVFEQVLLQADGDILIVASRPPSRNADPVQWNAIHPAMVVVRLSPTGAVDPTYGSGGVAEVPMQEGCECRDVAALQSNGDLVLTGQIKTGFKDSIWAVTRLTASGRVDGGFGHAGVATIPVDSGVGLSVGVTAADAIVTQGQAEWSYEENVTGPGLLLTRLTADGAPDPSFAGGKPFLLWVASVDDSWGQEPSPTSMLVQPDGSVMVESFPVPADFAHPQGQDVGFGIARYTPSGLPDPTFGHAIAHSPAALGGLTYLPESRPFGAFEMLPAPAGGLYVADVLGGTADGNYATPGGIQIQRLDRYGNVDTSFGGQHGLTLTIPFGGGEGEFLSTTEWSLASPPTLGDNTFLPGSGDNGMPPLLAQPDGTYLLPGGVSVTAAIAGNAVREQAQFALASLTANFALNPAFGGPPPSLQLTLSLPRQRTRGDIRRHAVLVRFSASFAGLCDADVYSGRHLIAQRLVPLLAPGTATIPVRLTASRGTPTTTRTRLCRSPSSPTLETSSLTTPKRPRP